jgi:hypothetical protein
LQKRLGFGDFGVEFGNGSESDYKIFDPNLRANDFPTRIRFVQKYPGLNLFVQK